MSKKTITLAPAQKPDRPQARLAAICLCCALGALTAPLIAEGVALCYAGWCDILDRPVVVRTPVLDSIGEHYQNARDDIRNAVSPYFQRVPWNPRIVLAAATVIMGLAMVMLRS
jgi:hypothetical protein